MNRAEAQRDARREKVAALYLAGRVQSEIARELKVSQQVVSYDLQHARQQWQASMLQHTVALKAQKLAELARVKAEAWRAWERSQQPREIMTDTPHGVSVRREAQVGDPAFLGEIRAIVMDEVKVLGLAAPTRLAIDLEAATPEQLIRIAQGEAPERVFHSSPQPMVEA
jgi:DNA-binding CsgD family transcriptional regulator